MPYALSSRDPIGSAESYPLRRERLDAALTAAGVENVDTIYFMRGFSREWRYGGGRVMTVDFKPSSMRGGERIEIRIHALPAAEKVAVAGALDRGSLERVATWIRAAEVSENVWRSTAHRLTVRWSDNGLTIDEG